jgi:transcriptional regulator MftR-like protein
VRLAFQCPALQGEMLRTQYAAQQALAEAIADRTGSDAESDLFPAVMAGAVTAATHVAMNRWLTADPPLALAPLLRQALGQLSLIGRDCGPGREPGRDRQPGQNADSELGCDRQEGNRSWRGS